jgi:Mg2+-importing ATPase
VSPTTDVPGDIVVLSAGSLVPADGVILESADLFLSEAVLTGRVFRWRSGRAGPPSPPHCAIDQCVFRGNVRSGTATCRSSKPGCTQFGQIAERLTGRSGRSSIAASAGSDIC